MNENLIFFAAALNGERPVHNPTARIIQSLTEEQFLKEWELVVTKQSRLTFRQREFLKYRVAFIRAGKKPRYTEVIEETPIPQIEGGEIV